MRGRNVGLVAVVLAIVAVAAWWFGGRGDVASVDDGPAGDREAPGAIDPARPEAALAGQGRAKSAVDAPAARRVLGRPKAVEGASIRGIVVDGAGVAVAGARVVAIPDTATKFLAIEAVGAEGGTGAENFTDAQGRFVVAAVGDAPIYALLAQADGFALTTKPAVRVGEDVRLVLGAGLRLSGRVLTIDGEPIPGATVRVATTTDAVRLEVDTVSGADGAYAVEHLPTPADPSMLGVTSYTAVSATKEGYAPLMVPGLGRTVPGRRDVRQLDLVLIRGATVVGRVVSDEDGAPIEGARVVLWTIESLSGMTRASGVSLSNPWTERVVHETTSGADGAFRIEHVPANGFHRIDSHNMGRRGMTLGYVAAGKPGLTWGSDEVPVVADGAVVETTLRLAPAASVRGRVVTSAGRPLAGATVYAGKTSGSGAMVPPSVAAAGEGPWTKSAADGTYRLAAVPAGSRGATRVILSGYPSHPAPAFRQPPKLELDVVADQETQAPDLVFEAAEVVPTSAAGAFTLRIKDPDGRPIAGATWIGTGQQAIFRPDLGTRSDRDGVLRVPISPPRPGARAGTLVVMARGFAPSAVEAPLEAKADTEVPVILSPARRITGRVLSADRTPPPASARVSVYNAAVPIDDLLPKPGTPAWMPRAPRPTDPPLVAYASAAVAEDGSFVVEDLPEGPYHVIASAGAGGPQRTAATPPATLANVATDATGLELVLGAPTRPEGGRILGTVVDAETGRPVGTIDVVATRRRTADDPPPGPTMFRSADGTSVYSMGPTGPIVTLTSPGRYEATGTEPGTYDLVVKATGYVPARVDGVSVATTDVEVPTVRLSRGLRVHGRVRLPDGETPLDRTLTFVAERTGPDAVAGSVVLTSTGTYELTGLTPGRYRVVATGSGFVRPPIAALVRAGDEPVVLPERTNDVELALDLVLAGTLRITVTDPRLPSPPWMGRPASDAQAAFGKGSSLTVTRADGTVVQHVAALTEGVPAAVGFLNLLPGTYRVRLSMPAGEVDERTVEVAPGAAAAVSLGQAPAPTERPR